MTKTSMWRYRLHEHRLLLWAVALSPCHLFWLLPLLGALLAPTPLDGLFARLRFPLELTLAVLLSAHSIVVIARWALRPRNQSASGSAAPRLDSDAASQAIVQ